eukprot:NODE_5_length_72347_cov_1.339331.p24 type:complete len:331 gc:universal NODE_5_length_72347_cov_1.339331:55269-54277(-)
MDAASLQLLANPSKIDDLSANERNEFEQNLIEFFLTTEQLSNVVNELTQGITTALGNMLTGGDMEVDENEEDMSDEEDEEDDSDIDMEEDNVDEGTVKLYPLDLNEEKVEFIMNTEELEITKQHLIENQLYLKLKIVFITNGQDYGVELLIGYDGEFLLQSFSNDLQEWDRSKTAKLLYNKIRSLFYRFEQECSDFDTNRNTVYLYDAKNGIEFPIVYENRPPEAFFYNCLAIYMQNNVPFKPQALPESFGYLSHFQDLYQIGEVKDGKIEYSFYLSHSKDFSSKSEWYPLAIPCTTFTDAYVPKGMKVIKNGKDIGFLKSTSEVIAEIS